ncbi:MAG: ATP-binding protein, partial [Dokdonella sp.]
LARDGDQAEIRVRDHGPGVADAELHRIIEPFYRTDNARARSSGGTGLGLAIAHSAILKHGGALQVRNADGGGLEVLIRLPLLASA